MSIRYIEIVESVRRPTTYAVDESKLTPELLALLDGAEDRDLTEAEGASLINIADNEVYFGDEYESGSPDYIVTDVTDAYREG